MKIRKKNLFSPVVITIEKKSEAVELADFLEDAFSKVPDQQKGHARYDVARQIAQQLRYATSEDTEE